MIKYGAILNVIILFFYHSFLFANTFTPTIGFRSSYTTGISEENISYKPFGKLSYKMVYLKTEVIGIYSINQQIQMVWETLPLLMLGRQE